MNKILTTLLMLSWLFFSQSVMANLCGKVTDEVTIQATQDEIVLYQTLFPNADFHGSLDYDGFILECNRRRDNKGDEVRKMLTRDDWADMRNVLNENDLPPFLFDASYKFFGAAWFKMRYLVWKEAGIWHLLIPYNPIINDVVDDRIDFNMDHAAVLYERDQVNQSGSGSSATFSLIPGAQPIRDTLCNTTTFFEGKASKYNNKNGVDAHKRDRENKHISLGMIEYSYKDAVGNFIPVQGCRVMRNVPLYATNPITGTFERILPEDWILNNFEQINVDYWGIPANFQLHILLRGHNENRLSTTVQAHINEFIGNNDYLKVRFGTKFMPGGNQMYKTNAWQPNNFSTMTTDEIYLHEVGHAFGLDDEYAQGSAANKRKHCQHAQYNKYDGTSGTVNYTIDDYIMCNGNGSQTNTIYHYLAVSRYILSQRCKNDEDCGAGQFCNKRIGVNRCLADRSLELSQSCIKNKECESGKCQGKGDDRMCVCANDGDCGSGQFCNKRLGQNRCLADASIALGVSCNKNAECASGKCQGKSDNRVCVCANDSDCGSGQFCNNRAGKNRCLADASIALGVSCNKNAECASGKCQGSGNNRTCVCANDTDCGSGLFCNKRAGKNRCLADASKNLGASCDKNAECASGKCQGSGNNRTCVCANDSDCGSGLFCNNRTGKNRCLADASKNLGASCDKNAECASGKCQGSGTKRACVCAKNSDCPGNQKCKTPVTKANFCK